MTADEIYGLGAVSIAVIPSKSWPYSEICYLDRARCMRQADSISRKHKVYLDKGVS